MRKPRTKTASLNLLTFEIVIHLIHLIRLYLAETLRAAGWKTAKELRAPETNLMEDTSSIDARKTSQEIQFPIQQGEQTLIVVATLVAALTFAAALNPPGGVIQMPFEITDRNNSTWLTNWNDTKTLYPVGSPVYLWSLKIFFFYDYLALLSSIFVILLCLPGLIPRSDYITKNYTGPLLPLVMWSSMFFMVLAFRNALSILLYTDSKLKSSPGGITVLFDICIYFFAILGIILWCKFYATLTLIVWGIEIWESSWMNTILCARELLAYICSLGLIAFASAGVGSAIVDIVRGFN